MLTQSSTQQQIAKIIVPNKPKLFSQNMTLTQVSTVEENSAISALVSLQNAVVDPNKILYYVSNKGRVKRTEKGAPSIGFVTKKYLRYGEKYRVFVHQVVCYKFNGPPPAGKPTVNHLDNNGRNNNAENLEWASQQEQIQHIWKDGNNLREANVRMRKRLAASKAVESCKIGVLPEVWTRHPSTQAAADACETYQGGVSNTCAGRNHSSGGYKFRWAEPESVELLPEEEWRPAICNKQILKNWSISNMGRIKSPTGVISYGCKADYMVFGCQTKHYYVHFVVMHTFVGGPPLNIQSATVDHIDRDGFNNKLSNLRWATKNEQAQNRKNSVRRGPNIAILYRPLGESQFIRAISIAEAERETRVTAKKIRDCCKFNQNYQGFEFKFADEIGALEGEIWLPFFYKDFVFLRSLPKNVRIQVKESPTLKRYRAKRTEKNKALQEKNKKRKVDNE